MRRQENQPPRPTTDWLTVPLFNQKKRNRIPLTSAPSENEFFSHSEFMATSSSATSQLQPGGYPQASGPSSGGLQTLQWKKQSPPQSSPSQQYGSNRPAPGPAPAARAYGLMPHPYKDANKSSAMGQPSNPPRQQDSSFNFKQDKYPQSAASKPSPHAGLSQKGQQPAQRPPNATQQYCQPRPPAAVPPPGKASAPTAQPQKNSWKFTNSFEALGSSSEGKMSSSQSRTVKPTSSQGKLPTKPAVENSLRILTAVIEGMRHWSKFKDRVPYLFEIFGTLDSAVTLGRYGAKNFLMRDGKDVVQCVFYENERVLPRLIRGQVHRCVGNYDRSRDVLVCVSVRPGLPSELRNALEAVKASDAEMRALAKSFSEV